MHRARKDYVIMEAKKQAKYDPWSSKIRELLTGEEINVINRHWQKMKGIASWFDAFMDLPVDS